MNHLPRSSPKHWFNLRYFVSSALSLPSSCAMTIPVKDGTIPFVIGEETFQTYYKVFGDIASSTQPPLVVLHGGPGIAHNYMVPVGDLAGQSSTAVIMYDQIGCGRSTHLQSKPVDFWTIDLFIAELENLLLHFSIVSSFDLLGHSWGATLAAEFVVRRQPSGLRRLILANCLASAKARNIAVATRRKQLSEDIQETLRAHEQAGTVMAPEYKRAMQIYRANFSCRIQPFPDDVAFSFDQIDIDSTVIKAMRKGPTGLEDKWDITESIHLIRIPTLLINSEYDFMMDEVCAPYFERIEKIKWVKFANSSHMPHIDKANPHRVLGDYSGQMQMTSLGTVVSEHRTVLMKGGISTVVQFRAMDWGMETCELHISIPRETSNLTISRPNQSISVFQLNTTIVQDGTTLSYNTRPPPFLKLTDLTVDSANGAVWKQEFSCSEEEILTFELACPVTEQTENGCHVEWIQEKSPLDAVIFMRQYATA
ncbi:hypothetical protein D9757_009143 [Collybiopsis confluens]|uniref:AB hydrolase-1 domain-containing protein n=1 Tax=Collybiopsis confluens TaxID=2823264 RepID=A0A8H5H7V5_9AGAR|nr:hypothetical protein D9757_009149 [Collybiopsis confluens]KAF5378258.1 hypothetical protein D9757_009143 [Collybiopsis confluens]